MRPHYTKKKIGTIDALCRTLRISEDVLRRTLVQIQKHYTPYEIPKATGGMRSILIPSLHLKTIQKRINREIFSHVQYPSYLYGGIEEKDYVKNAKAHAGAYVVIALDARNFYPSIQFEDVVGIFQHLFKFSPNASQLLAELCTFEGKVPQGACTSSHIANLVLHDVEYRRVQHFVNCKLTYTRLLDDICISAARPLSQDTIEDVIRQVAAMLKPKNIRLHNKKKRISSKSNPHELMEITGLWLNRGAPRARPSDRRNIRTEVYRCAKAAEKERFSAEYHSLFGSASGKVAKLTYLGHAESVRLRATLRNILPLYDQPQIDKTVKIVRMLATTSERDRRKYSFIESYNQVQHRVNIVARTKPQLARTLRSHLKLCKPLITSDAAMYDEPI